MPLQTEEREIGGVQFRVRQIPLKESRAALVVLTRTFGGVLSGLLKAATAEKIADLDTAALAGAVSSFVDHLSDADLEFLTKTFCTGEAAHAAVVMKADGSPCWVPLSNEGVRGEVFGGRLLLFFQWLWFAIEVNYSDFLAGIRTASGKLPIGKVLSKSPSPAG